jgi:hypothetical protein
VYKPNTNPATYLISPFAKIRPESTFSPAISRMKREHILLLRIEQAKPASDSTIGIRDTEPWGREQMMNQRSSAEKTDNSSIDSSNEAESFDTSGPSSSAIETTLDCDIPLKEFS